jgi:surface protein
MCNWNTSNVTDMSGMFYRCRFFNADIGAWDTSKVTTMASMFQGSYISGNISVMAFNKSLNNWNVSKVTNMSNMFYSGIYNQPLNNWDTRNVTNMGGMFEFAFDFNQPIGSWNTSKVTNMGAMFRNASDFNQNIETWDVSNVTNMGSMFAAAYNFNQPLGRWDVSKVTNMANMFDAEFGRTGKFLNFNQDLSQWCVSLIPTEPNLFKYDAPYWTLPKPVWGTCPVQPFTFEATIPAVGQINPNGISMTVFYSFFGTYGNVVVDWGDGTSNTYTSGTTAGHTYASSGVYTVKVYNARGIDASGLKYMTKITRWSSQPWNVMKFDGQSNLVSITAPGAPKFSDFGISSITIDLQRCFAGCTKLQGSPSFNSWNLTNTYSTYMPYMFLNASVFNWDLSTWCVPQATSTPIMFDTGATAWTLPRPIWGTCP